MSALEWHVVEIDALGEHALLISFDFKVLGVGGVDRIRFRFSDKRYFNQATHKGQEGKCRGIIAGLHILKRRVTGIG